MRTFQRLSALSAAAVLGLALAACGSTTTHRTSSTSPPPQVGATSPTIGSSTTETIIGTASGATAFTGHKLKITATGAFVDSGVLLLRGGNKKTATGKLVLRLGTITIRHTRVTQSAQFNDRTCTEIGHEIGTYKLLGGTRYYIKLKGHGSYSLTYKEVVPRRKLRRCSPNAKPLQASIRLVATGPARVSAK